MRLKTQVLSLQNQVAYLLRRDQQSESSTDSSSLSRGIHIAQYCAIKNSFISIDVAKTSVVASGKLHRIHTGIWLFHSHAGCWLGDPHGDNVWVANGAAEVVSNNPAKLALALMAIFFTKKEMANGNCNPAPSRQLLNPNVITGIRCKFHAIITFF